MVSPSASDRQSEEQLGSVDIATAVHHVVGRREVAGGLRHEIDPEGTGELHVLGTEGRALEILAVGQTVLVVVDVVVAALRRRGAVAVVEVAGPGAFGVAVARAPVAAEIAPVAIPVHAVEGAVRAVGRDVGVLIVAVELTTIGVAADAAVAVAVLVDTDHVVAVVVGGAGVRGAAGEEQAAEGSGGREGQDMNERSHGITSTRQSASQPSPGSVLPSSHSSNPTTTPSPQTMGACASDSSKGTALATSGASTTR